MAAMTTIEERIGHMEGAYASGHQCGPGADGDAATGTAGGALIVAEGAVVVLIDRLVS